MSTSARSSRSRPPRRVNCCWLLAVVAALVAVPPAGAAPGAAEPTRLGEQWNLRQIGADRAWSLTRGSPDVIVGVIDTGVDADHPELRGKVVAGRNFGGDPERTNDRDGHGTFVSGVIAAQGIEMWGVAPGVKIMPLKVFGPDTRNVDPLNDWTGIALATAQALRWGVDHGARVFNISLGWPENVRELQDALDYAWDKGALVFVASGNDDQDYVSGAPAPNYPAASRHAIAVAATNTRGEHAGYSSRGPFVQLSAPGGDEDAGVSMAGSYDAKSQLILGPLASTRRYDYESGTSFASPHAAGVAALLWSINPNLTNGELLAILHNTAQKPGNFADRTDSYGYGRIDAYRAVLAALPGPLAVAVTAPREHAAVGGALEITGWAGATGALASGDVDVDLYLEPEEGATIALGRATGGLPTPEVAQLTNNPRLGAAGYRLSYLPTGIPRGRYRVRAVATSPSGDKASFYTTVDINLT